MSTAALRQRLAELDAEITQQKLALTVLEQNLTDVQRQLFATAIFPVLKLPNELTSEIFALCVPAIEELREGKYTRPAALWATLKIRFDLIDKDIVNEPGKVETFVEQWLQRAARRPLNYIPFHQKIEYLELYSRHPLHQLGLDLAAFPLLKRVAVGDFFARPNTLNPYNVFAHAPQLHTLLLPDEVVLPFLRVPWQQLTRFEGGVDNFQLFRTAPNLIEAKCSVQDVDEADFFPITPISHACLQSLTLTLTIPPWQGGIDILSCLTLPALRSLHICDTIAPIDDHSMLLRRSAVSLRTFSVNVHCDRHGKWAKFFSRSNDTLENLEVLNPSEEFLKGILLPDPSSRDLYRFPRLQTLSLINPPDINYTVLANFLRKRSTSTELAKLQSFRLECSSDAFMNDESSYRVGIDDLSTLARGGMDIYIGIKDKSYVNHVRVRV
ncbi:F-box domain-containing protein [Mycena venus]|uniref:F-box domain-containing protein n=1 Tax=Mycena venus TaxID=2733690 RepID=A0A8H6Y4N6_9AGAR|nr:F-box domain-containing protein [Mycena venus]